LRQALQAAPALLEHEPDLDAVLATLKAEFPTLEAFERDFPSLCFALATGVGKTRLMGAFIGYLHLAHGFEHFFVLAPNLTIWSCWTRRRRPSRPLACRWAPTPRRRLV
jgi:type III restriction enzyme